MTNKIFKKRKGYALLELIVAVSIFSVLMIVVSQIFMTVNKSQRKSIAAQDIQESIRYAFEVISKEIRMAIEDSEDNCLNVTGVIYNTSDSDTKLHFMNYNSQCIEYSIESNRLKIDRDGNSAYLTPANLKVSNLRFDILDLDSTAQAVVTMRMEIEDLQEQAYNKPIVMQTTISARNYSW